MKHVRGQKSGQSAKELASWTQASLLTVGSSLRSAGSSLLTGIRTGYEQLTLDHSDKERVAFVKFGSLEYRLAEGAETSCAVLLLGYEVGFQIWSLKDAVKEIASRRDGRVRCLESLPLPLANGQSSCPLLHAWPLVAAVMDAEERQTQPDVLEVVSYVKLYSLQTHSYVHTLEVPGKVLSASCSRRVLLVAMSSQIMAYDLATLAVSYSAITYPAPSLGDRPDFGATPVPLALGTRWLAHASNQPVQNVSGIALAQPIANNHSRGQQGANNIEAVQHYAALAAKTSGKHIKSLGEASYKYLSFQMDTWRHGASAPSSPSSSQQRDDSEIVGTVIVRDMVNRTTLVHFRAHPSPLLFLRFDGSGTLLVTASVHGHTVNIFHIAPGTNGSGGSAAHLFRLTRGVTPAVIQDVGFSCCGQWLCVSSARGTTHVFKLSIPGRDKHRPPHLAAIAIPASERSRFQAIKLQAVGRARQSGILNGSIPGSAAASAAVNLYNKSSGGCLMASSFMPQPSSTDLSSCRGASAAEDLFVASNDGLLVRHRLSAIKTPSQSSASAVAEPVNSHEEDSGELAVEAVEQWDVCRRQAWPEREELLNGSDSSGEEGEVEQRPPWSSHAELCVPSSSGALPLWADPQFHILEMQTGRRDGEPSQLLRGADEQKLGGSAILQVEEFPTKRINTQGRTGLAPVIIEGAETAVLRGAQLSSAPDRSSRE